MAYAMDRYRQLKRTMASNRNMRTGLVKVMVIICRAPFFSSSIGAKILGLPVCLRIRCAFRLSIVGPYVSGKKHKNAREAPAIINPAQKVHRQVRTEMNPDMLGASTGPHAVACTDQCGALKQVYGRTPTAIKKAMARPRVIGLP